MKSNIFNIKGMQVLSRESQRTIMGSAGSDPSLCGCSCSGSVTGPFYCHKIIACLQVYTCNEVI